MRPAATTFAVLVSLAGASLLLARSGERTAEGSELEQYEEKLINRWVDKGYRIAKSDRTQWIRELENAFPDRVVNALKEDEYASWFVLLAGKAAEWRRDDAPNAQIAELFDKIVQRLELGPVPSIRREEFMKYARHALMPGNPNPPMPGADPLEDADKVFRVLDRNGDGVLQPGELTARLREDRLGATSDKNGGVTRDQYREYFRRQVTSGIESALERRAAEKTAEKAAAEKAAAEKAGRATDPKTAGPAKKPTPKLPAWFTELDTDMDGQVALHEWRKSGRSIALFMEMDLNGDGLLTKEEYWQYIRMKEKEKEPETDPPVVGKQKKN